MLKPCPDPIDVQDLQFKLQCRLKIFDAKDASAFPNLTSLVSCASRYGLIFCGSNTTGFQVIQTKCLDQYSPKDKEITDYPRRIVNLTAPPSHICVNCDSTILAVVYEKEKCSWAVFYDVLSFLKQNVAVIKEVRLSSSPGVTVREINWNPSLPGVFTACKSDGSLGVYELRENSVDVNEIPAASGATTFCWSPKGKQIAVGSKDGKITQYKPDLKAVKVVNSPPLEKPHSLISLQWVSNYQFVGVYQANQPEGLACLIVIDAPKTGDTIFTNYEDVCYSGTTRPPQFYMNLQSAWHLLMVASANSTELGVLGGNNDSWNQWIISDSARAELPLSADHQETLPIGVSVDISSTTPFPWGESHISPCPRLLLLSHQGLLCIFNIVNLKNGIPTLCTPPDSIADTSGLAHFTAKVEVSQAGNTFVSIASTPKPSIQSEIVAPKATFFFAGQPPQSPQTPVVSSSLPPRSSNLFGGQISLTPVSKINTPPATGEDNKYASIFTTLSTNKTKVEIPQMKPIVISSDKIQANASTPKIVSKKTQPELPKPDIVPVSTADVKNTAETQALLRQMIKDECLYLEKELRVLLTKGKSLQMNIGTESEKNDMVLKIHSLQDFLKELIDISLGQSGEIQDLKQHLIQSWAWFEEAKSRYNTSKDETMVLVLKSQPLDSAAEKRLKDIQHIMYYVESQLTQVNKALDEQWDQFQTYAKKRHSDKLPTMEAIFQTMVRQNVVLQKQQYVLRDISGRLKGKSRGKDGSSALLVRDKVKELERGVKNISLDAHDVFQVQYEQVLNRSKDLTENKSAQLRNVLTKRNVFHVTATKPQVSSLTINGMSPLTKSRLHSLSSQISPIKNSAIRNLNFGDELKSTNMSSDASKTSIFSNPGSAFVATNQALGKPSIFGANVAQPVLTNTVDLSKDAEANKGLFGSSNLFGAKVSKIPAEKPSFDNVASPSLSKSSTKSITVLQNTTVSTSASSQKLTSSYLPTENKFGISQSAPNEPPVITPKINKDPDVSTLKSNVFAPSSTPTVPVTFGFSGFGSKQQDQKVFVATTTSPFSFGAPKASPFTFTSSSFGSFENKEKSVKTDLPKSSTTAVEANTNENISKTQEPGKSFFGNTQSFSKKEGSIFGATTPATTSVQSPSIFSKPSATSQATIFGNPSVSSITSTTSSTTTSSSMFGMAVTSVPSTDAVISSSSQTNIFAQGTSIFGQQSATPVTKSNIFATAEKDVTAATPSIFGQQTSAEIKGNIFGQQQKVVTATAVSQQPTSSIFGSSTATTPQTSSLSQKASQVTPTTITVSLFSQPVTTTGSTANIFGQQPTATQKSTATAVTSASVFQQQSSPVSSTGTFGLQQPQSSAVTAASTASVFKAPTASIGGSIFSQPTTTATVATFSSASNIFGENQQPSTTTGSIFGQQSLSTTTTGSIFGQQASTSAAPSIFGQQSSTSTAPSVFAQQSPASTTPNGIFSQQSSAPIAANAFGQQSVTSTAPSVFGQQSTTSTTPSVFGQQSPTTTAPSVFGQQSSTTASGIFGQQPSASTGPSVFAQQTTSDAPSGSFGQQPTSTAPSVFGQQSTPSTAGTFNQQAPSVFNQKAAATPGVFGQSQTAAFKGGNVFGSTGGTPTTSASIFGKPAFESSTTAFGGSPSIFGGSTATSTSANVFGNTSTTSFGGTSQNTFGNPTSTPSVFGNAAATTTASVFGSATTTGSVFGSGFGAASSAENSVFGGSPQTSSASTAFGFGGLNVGATATTASSGFGSFALGGAQTNVNPFAKTEEKSPFSGGSLFTKSSSFGSNTNATFGQAGQGAAFGSPAFGAAPAFGQQQQKSAFGQGAFGGGSFGSPQPGPFSGGTSGTPVAQSGFGSPAGFGGGFGAGSPAFGGAPSFGGSPTFGSAATFGSPGKVFGMADSANNTFGTPTQQSAGFGNLANQNTIGFGNLAQQGNAQGSSQFSGSSSFSNWR